VNPLLIAVPTALTAGAVATPKVDLLTDDVGEKLTRLDRDAELNGLLAGLKARRGLLQT
jgi:hypothetical protein